jgi:hypothetical protein
MALDAHAHDSSSGCETMQAALHAFRLLGKRQSSSPLLLLRQYLNYLFSQVDISALIDRRGCETGES